MLIKKERFIFLSVYVWVCVHWKRKKMCAHKYREAGEKKIKTPIIPPPTLSPRKLG